MRKRTFTIGMGLTEDEYRRAKEKADRLGMPVSTFIRSAAFNGECMVDVPALIQEVRRMGIVLGRILERMEEGERPEYEEIRKAAEECRTVEKHIVDACTQ